MYWNYIYDIKYDENNCRLKCKKKKLEEETDNYTLITAIVNKLGQTSDTTKEFSHFIIHLLNLRP